MAKQKAQIELIRLHALPHDLRLAILSAKNRIRNQLPGRRKVFDNQPALLPNLDDGCEYYEFDVGAARAGDPEGQRGKRRLVVEIVTKSSQIREMYFTDDHYTSGSFRRIV